MGVVVSCMGFACKGTEGNLYGFLVGFRGDAPLVNCCATKPGACRSSFTCGVFASTMQRALANTAGELHLPNTSLAKPAAVAGDGAEMRQVEHMSAVGLSK